MIYGIVGAPGTDKSDVAQKLSEALSLPATSGHLPMADVPLGLQADYRTELNIASSRAMWMSRLSPTEPGMIYWHTLIDSLAYATVRLTTMLKNEGDPLRVARWSMVNLAISAMAEDTKHPDLYLFIPYKGTDEDSLALSQTLQDALDVYEQKYRCIIPNQGVDAWLTS